MKRLITFCLIGLFLTASVQRAPAPGPGVFLPLVLKCVGIGVIAATARIVYRCEPSYYLIKVETEDELYWLVSQASVATVKKNEGWTRCRGPYKDRSEPEFEAWCNNRSPNFPMFGCSAIGGPMPGPVWTNYMNVTLEQSNDGGSSWASIASTVVAAGNDGSDEGWSFAVLPPTGTAGMTRDQIAEVNGCSAVVTNTSTAVAALWRTRYDAAEPLAGNYQLSINE